jgi:hypothetical protein
MGRMEDGNMRMMGNLEALGIFVKSNDVSPNINGSSYGDTVSVNVPNLIYEKGKLVKWVSKDSKEIVWLVNDRGNEGVVIHSDGLMSVGTVSNLEEIKGIESFIGTVNIVSQAKE